MIDHTLLEYDEETGWALAMTSLTAPQPFVVCYRYDPASGEWAQGHYYSTLEDAVVDYNRMVDGVDICIENEDEFCTIRWRREDVAQAIAFDLGPDWVTESNVDAAIRQIGDRLQDRSIEEGWEILNDLIDPDDLERPASQGARSQ